MGFSIKFHLFVSIERILSNKFGKSFYCEITLCVGGLFKYFNLKCEIIIRKYKLFVYKNLHKHVTHTQG